MRWHMTKCLALATIIVFIFQACATNTHHRQTLSHAAIDEKVAPGSLTGPGRKIMRLSDGRILASFDVVEPSGTAPSLFAEANIHSAWTDVSGKLSVTGGTMTTSDTGPAGTYVAFVDSSSKAGAVAHFPDPVGTPGVAKFFRDLTPANATDTFVAASKGEESTNTVAYAWRHPENGEIYFGFSSDGRNFEKARVIVHDENLNSGPSLAVNNDYVLLTYLTRDPKVRPTGAADNTAFPVWVESWDGGRTFSDPKPLFGTRITEFPKAEEVLKAADNKALPLYAAGGSRLLGNALAWPKADIGARIFIITGQSLVTSEGRSPGNAQPVVGIVSFKDLSDGPEANWKHVFASEYNPDVTNPDRGRNTAFQYSALPGSSIRAVAYLEQGPHNSGNRIAISVSVNTGKSFDRFVKIDLTKLGLKPNEEVQFTTSTCLLVNDKGDVFLDTAYSDPKTGMVRVAQLPLGVNVKSLPPSSFNIAARWP